VKLSQRASSLPSFLSSVAEDAKTAASLLEGMAKSLDIGGNLGLVSDYLFHADYRFFVF